MNEHPADEYVSIEKAARSAGNAANFLAIIEGQGETITQLEARLAGMEWKGSSIKCWSSCKPCRLSLPATCQVLPMRKRLLQRQKRPRIVRTE
jgi:hypothetical protein